MTLLIWLGILLCLSQSAILSGLNLRRVIQLHMAADESDIAQVEGQGALNFLDLDDVPLDDEGEPVDPKGEPRR
jgi:hypothetical protein